MNTMIIVFTFIFGAWCGIVALAWLVLGAKKGAD